MRDGLEGGRCGAAFVFGVVVCCTTVNKPLDIKRMVCLFVCLFTFIQPKFLLKLFLNSFLWGKVFL